MPRAFIQDFRQDTTAAERAAYRTTLFEAATGDASVGELPWGREVEIVERRSERVEVRDLETGAAGFVDDGAVVEERFVRTFVHRGELQHTAPLHRRETGSETVKKLLWGDRVLVLRPGSERSRVRARGRYGWVDNEALGETPLLEVYFIDVGQGDGVLIRFPDGRHMLIDGGYLRRSQPSGKNAADFVDWKFFVDYGDHRMRLDAVVASHCDADHYGGLWDLVKTSGTALDELDCEGVEVGTFFHAGVSWWETDSQSDGRWLGPSENGRLVQLLDGDQDDLGAVTAAGAEPRLQGYWRQFLDAMENRAERFVRVGVPEGTDPLPFLPGWEDHGDGQPTIRVLAPVTREVDGRPTVLDLGSESQNTNGHSALLAMTYGSCRILLTGDLNKQSMQALLAAYDGREEVFACDVAKGCHHGSEDVSLRFLEAMEAGATVISSGDNEGHAHPRPVVVAASGITGHRTIDADEDELVTPLVYSTEVERSVKLGELAWIDAPDYPKDDQGGLLPVRLFGQASHKLPQEHREQARALETLACEVVYDETTSGAFGGKEKRRRLAGSYVVGGIVYGLVNVRTDGETVLCATMNEAEEGWTVRTFPARF